MMKWRTIFMTIALLLTFAIPTFAASDQYVYDDAGLLTADEVKKLETLAKELSAERDTAFIILTTNNTNGQYIMDYMGDFIDANTFAYDNIAILSLDMFNRDVYLAGFGKAETYLDSSRLDKIRTNVTPNLSNGEYYMAFKQFMEDSHYYMQFEPGFNPDNIFFKLWFQLLVALGVAVIVVGVLVATRGGRVTVNSSTYADLEHSGVTNSSDQYITTHITKIKKPSNNNGGPGGGVTGGGRSFSGSGGKF